MSFFSLRYFVADGVTRQSASLGSALAVIALLMTCSFHLSAVAQQSAAEHASHHPGTTAASGSNPSPAEASSGASMGAASTPDLSASQTSGAMPVPPAGMAGMMEGMQKMMGGAMGAAGGGSGGCCGGAESKELYPVLMGLPSLTPEKRAEVRRLSEERIYEGTMLLQSAQERLSISVASGDHDVAQLALQQLRDGLGRVGSGVAVHKLLQQGTPPQNVAAQWFKHEMSLPSTVTPEASRGVFGILPLHLFVMALLVAFALAMVAMYFFKMRRAAALFGRIEPDPGAPPPGMAPPLSGTPGPPAPPAPSAGGSQSPILPLGATAGTVPAVQASSLLSSKWRGQLRVMSIVTETPNVTTIRLQAASGEGALPFTFAPGQFLNVAFSIGGARMIRSYSISSSPTQRDHVDLTVKREPRGAVSRHINDLLKVGDQIEVSGPLGKSTFTGIEADSVVLIAGGVGITPMMSIARYLTDRSWPGDIFFLYACRTPTDFIFSKDIAELQRRNPKLHVVVVMEHPEGTDWQGPRGRLTKELFTEAVPDIASRRIQLCGPPVMMNAVKAILSELKVPPEQVRTEDFGSAAPIPGTAGTSAKFTDPATGPLVTFTKNGKSSRIHVDQTVLELSEELNIGIEFACRVGTCGICKVKMTSGEVEMAVEDGLDADDKAGGMILACQAKPTSPVAVEA